VSRFCYRLRFFQHAQCHGHMLCLGGDLFVMKSFTGLTFVLSTRHPRCCQQSLNLFCCDIVNPAWSIILTHCHLNVALLPPRPVSYALPTTCLLFAPVLFVLLLFRFRFIIVREDFFPAELTEWSDLLCPFLWLALHDPVVHLARLFQPTFLFLFW